MAKRGRPMKYGRQPAWMLVQRVMVLHAFNEARKNGEKYEAAVAAAIESVKARYPKMQIAPRMVKEILAKWQPKESPEALVVSEVSDDDIESPEMHWNIRLLGELGWPKDRKVKAFTNGFGPRPQHPRINAKAHQGASSRQR